MRILSRHWKTILKDDKYLVLMNLIQESKDSYRESILNNQSLYDKHFIYDNKNFIDTQLFICCIKFDQKNTNYIVGVFRF